jgi:hypothetical protein
VSLSESICTCEFYLTLILAGKLTENTFSFLETTWGIVTVERRLISLLEAGDD